MTDRTRITGDDFGELLPAAIADQAGAVLGDAERRARWAEAELEDNLRAGVADVFSRN